VADPVCEHCGQSHPATTPFCPNTGRKLSGSVAPPDPPGFTLGVAPTRGDAAEAPPVDSSPEVGVFDLLQQAFGLYRRHARMLLTVAGIIFIPGALAHACARAAILAPTIVVNVVVDPVSHQPTTAPIVLGTAALGFPAMMLGLLALAVTGLLLHGVIVPLVQGALALATADRLDGGEATWQQIWTLLFRRLGTVLSAVIPAALLTGVGFFFLLVPGLLLAFFFSFVPLVALFEGVGGTPALRRSYELVRSDWLRMLILLFVFGVISWITKVVAGAFLAGLFGSQLLQDVLTLVVLPVPVIASVLLYLDVRRKRDGDGGRRLADDLVRLRAGA
jgi:hypothetical protein